MPATCLFCRPYSAGVSISYSAFDDTHGQDCKQHQLLSRTMSTRKKNKKIDVKSRHENNPSFLPNPEIKQDAKTHVIAEPALLLGFFSSVCRSETFFTDLVHTTISLGRTLGHVHRHNGAIGAMQKQEESDWDINQRGILQSQHNFSLGFHSVWISMSSDRGSFWITLWIFDRTSHPSCVDFGHPDNVRRWMKAATVVNFDQ